MGNGFMLVIALLYLGAAIGYAKDRNWWMALTVLCYAVANVALVAAVAKRV